MDSAYSKAMPEVGKLGRQRPAPRYRGKQNHRIRKQSPRLSIRKSARLQERGDGFTQRLLADIGTERIYSLPSPAAEVPQNLPSLSPARSSKRRTQTSSQDGKFEEVEQLQLGTERYTTGELGRKRKRTQETGDSTSQLQGEPTQKRTRTSQLDGAAKDTEIHKGIEDEKCYPIEHWVKTGSWPENFFEKDQKMSEPSSKKRSRSTSYAQSVKDGDNPRAYTPKYEEVLEKAGIVMDANHDQATISDACQQLCNDLLSGEHEPSEHSLFQGDQFWTVLRRVRTRNEPRVFRDITPLIVPSVENLYICGNHHLEHLTEELNAVWTKCTTLAGPQPKPDFVIGLMSSAFTDEEILKLKSYTTPDRATLFTENMYFPFLMCEAKCGDQAINRADRQNAHSGSIAVNAIVQLYRALPPRAEPHCESCATSRVMELDKKVLAFSISHDHSMVKIYGHYALIKADKATFYRYPIRSFDFTFLNGKERWIAYNFTRKVYDKFAPMHLEIIRSAIAQLPDPSSESFTSDISFDTDTEGPDSQEIVASAPSSQETAIFKKPSLPPTIRMQQENDGLRDMLLRQQQEQQEQQRQQQEQISKLQDLLLEQQEEIIKMLRQQKSAKG